MDAQVAPSPLTALSRAQGEGEGWLPSPLEDRGNSVRIVLSSVILQLPEGSQPTAAPASWRCREYTWPRQPSGAPMRVSPEARFITRCVCEPDDLQPRELQQAAQVVQDWHPVAELAARHGVSGFVRQAVARDGVAVPPFVADGLRSATLAQITHVARLDATLARILPALQDAAIPTIVLKGPVLSRLVYPDPTLRPYSDIDLSVREADERRVVDTLMDAGLVEVPHGAEVDRLTHAHHVHGGAPFTASS